MAQPSPQQTHAPEPQLFIGRVGPLHFATTCTDDDAWAWLLSDNPTPPGRARLLSDAEAVP